MIVMAYAKFRKLIRLAKDTITSYNRLNNYACPLLDFLPKGLAERNRMNVLAL
jgi:hypothetical protein